LRHNACYPVVSRPGADATGDRFKRLHRY